MKITMYALMAYFTAGFSTFGFLVILSLIKGFNTRDVETACSYGLIAGMAAGVMTAITCLIIG